MEAKHRAPGAKICKEAGYERASKSKTLDKTRSELNRYKGYRSGVECWKAMEQTADDYRVTGINKHGKEFSRRLRADAVIGWAMIVKPPADVAADWDDAKKIKFLNDSLNVMHAIEPRLFRNKNLRMIAHHRDEDGDHDHVIGDARDEDGAYCGNVIDSKLYERINERYPALMRRLGWDIADVEVTDWKRYNADPAYAAAVDARRAGSGGLPVNDYAAKQAAKRAEQAAEMYVEAQGILQEAGKSYQEAQKARQEAQEDRDKVKAMLADTRRVMGAGEAHQVELARRRLPGDGDGRSDLDRKLGI